MRVYQNSKEMLSEVKRDLFEMWENLTMNSMQNKTWKFTIKEIQGYEFMLALEWRSKKETVWDLFTTSEFILAELKKYIIFIDNSGRKELKKENKRFLESYLKDLVNIMNKYKEKIKVKNLFEVLDIMSKEEYENIENYITNNKEEIINYMHDIVKQYEKVIFTNEKIDEIKFDNKFIKFFSTFFRLWIILDFTERIDEELLNPWEAYKVRFWVWWNFKEWDKFSYTYWERIMKHIKTKEWQKHQLNIIIDELVKNSSTRQAIIQIFDSNIDLWNLWWKHRIPCSMHYQYMIRSSWKKIPRRWWNNSIQEINWLPKMMIFYNMRSVDFLTHFPIDIAQAINMLSYVKNKVEKRKWTKIENWELIFSAQSLHTYSYDLIWKVF